VARRPSDEVSLDIVVALLGGLAVGVLVAAAIGVIGWLAGGNLGDFAEGFGLIAAAVAAVIILTRLKQTAAPPVNDR
jgi:hypothetical protein